MKVMQYMHVNNFRQNHEKNVCVCVVVSGVGWGCEQTGVFHKPLVSKPHPLYDLLCLTDCHMIKMEWLPGA